MARPDRYKAEQVVAALKETKGMVYLAADRLGCTANTVYSYIERYASVKYAFEAASEKMLDISELKLFNQIMDDKPWAIAFHLKTKGRKRGYGREEDHDESTDEELDALLDVFKGLTPSRLRTALQAAVAALNPVQTNGHAIAVPVDEE